MYNTSIIFSEHIVMNFTRHIEKTPMESYLMSYFSLINNLDKARII